LAKGKQVQRGVLWVVPWIYDIFLVLKERELWVGVEFWQEGGVRLRRRRRKRYDWTNFLLFENTLWTFCSKFKISLL
jgi:hypothetical protein